MSSFIGKLKQSRNHIIRTLGLFLILRSIYGISILVLAYILGWDLQDLREFEIMGFRIYILIIALVIVIILRRFYKIYKWWITLPEPTR